MQDANSAAGLTCQARFARRWSHLTRPHVRALAWLLDAPDLLDTQSGIWGGQIASLADLALEDGAGSLEGWLAALEADPAALDVALGTRHYSRLGLYAEKLLAFYFEHRGVLVAHGLQVRASKNDTVGEFDFLLRHGSGLLHWEFATKFYLLAGAPDASLDCLVGPNLADTLGAKMGKILRRQLALGRHPAATALLPQAVDDAQALVKGWLFYPLQGAVPLAGLAAEHNRGFWCPLAQLGSLAGDQFVILPRLLWLAPLLSCDVMVHDRDAVRVVLEESLGLAGAPVMVAQVAPVDGRDGWVQELARGFVVPDGWAARAGQMGLIG